MMAVKTSGVQVVVRVRPMNEQEQKKSDKPVVAVSNKHGEITVVRGTGRTQVRSGFGFDHVFGEFQTQEEIFEATLLPMIGDTLKGYESTVFAYGQTGTGKTFTMEGDINNPEQMGVIPRAARALFEKLSDDKYSDVEVNVSYLEIYNEELCDLLVQNGGSELRIMEDTGKRGRGVFCQGLKEAQASPVTEVMSAEDVLGLMRTAQERRKVGETKMNKQSSRSHCLFTLKVCAKVTMDDGSTMETVGKLHMVDLAGSECAKTAGDSSKDSAITRERKNINQSLLTLGRVICALKEGNVGRIPYRDSKLTRLLQEALGGRCKTCIIATVSPSSLAVEETISTLNYAQTAHGIQNKPVATSFMKIGGGGGAGSHGTGSSNEEWAEMETKLAFIQQQCEDAQAALAKKHEMQQEIIDRAEKAEEDLENARVQLEHMAVLEAELSETLVMVSQRDYMLDRRVDTEEKLTSEAKKLIHTLEASVADGNALHAAHVSRDKDEAEKRKATSAFVEDAAEMLNSLSDNVKALRKSVSARSDAVKQASMQAQDCSRKALETLSQQANSTAGTVEEQTMKAKNMVVEHQVLLFEALSSMEESDGRVGKELCDRITICQGDSESGLASLVSHIKSGDQVIQQWADHTIVQLDESSSQLNAMKDAHMKSISKTGSAADADNNSARDTLKQQSIALQKLASAIEELNKISAAHKSGLNQTAANADKATRAHLESLSQHTAHLKAALEAQVAGQCDAEVVSQIEKASSDVQADAQEQGDLLQTQANGLASAISQQNEDNVEVSHVEVLNSVQQYISKASTKHITALQSQQQGLSEAKAAQDAGNADAKHIDTLQSTNQCMNQDLQEQLTRLEEQKQGLAQVAADLKEQKSKDEQGLIKHLKEDRACAEAEAAKQINELKAQAQSLMAQNKALEEALEAQRTGQAQFVTNVMGGVDALIKSEMTKLTQMSVDQFSALQSSNAAINAVNNQIEKQIVEDSAASGERNNVTQTKVTEWGDSVHMVNTNVNALAGQNDAATGHVKQVSQVFGENVDTLMDETKAWGEANREVGAAIVAANERSQSTEADIAAMIEEHAAKTESMVHTVQHWGESIRTVVQMMEEATEQNSNIKQHIDMASERLTGNHNETLNLVRSWASSDRQCQGAIEVAQKQTNDISGHVSSENDAFMQSSATSLEETKLLQTGLVSANETTLAVDGEVNACMNQLEQAAARLNKGMAEATDAAQDWGQAAANTVSDQKHAVKVMIAPRKDVLDTMDTEKEHVLTSVQNAGEAIRSKVASHTADIKKTVASEKTRVNNMSAEHATVCNAISSTTQQAFEEASATHKHGVQQIGELHVTSEKELQQLNEDVAANCNSHQDGVTGCANAVRNYGENVAEMDKPAKPVSPRMQHQYSNKLSETPSQEVMLIDYAEQTDGSLYSGANVEESFNNINNMLHEINAAEDEEVQDDIQITEEPKTKMPAPKTTPRMKKINTGAGLKAPTTGMRTPRTSTVA